MVSSLSAWPVFLAAVSLVLDVRWDCAEGISTIDDVRFHIVRRYNDKCELVFSHQEVDPVYYGWLPQRPIGGIHLAATGDPRSMRVSWTSPTICFPARVEVEQPQRVGRKKFDAQMEEPYEFLNWGYRSGYFFHALLTGLNEETSYRYRVRCSRYRSDSFSFTTPPSHGSLSPVHVLLLGDHGTRLEGNRTLQAMVEANGAKAYDLVIHLGDISYANGGYGEVIWDVWADMVEPLAAQVSYMVTPGNHEILVQDSGGEIGIPYTKRFSMPMERKGSCNEYWYSWDYGQVHFVSVSSEHAQNSSQQQWIADDLRNANENRHKMPWVVVFGHQSIYTSNQRHGNHSELREWLDPLLSTYKVDIAFWGHDHAYERTYPITNSTVIQTNYEDPDAPVHVICGASGWDLHECWQPNVAFSAFHTGHTWGYCALHVISPTAADVEFVDSETRDVIDSFRLSKSRTGRSHGADINQASQNDLKQTYQHSTVEANEEEIVVNTLENPEIRLTGDREELTVDSLWHIKPTEKGRMAGVNDVTASDDRQATEMTSPVPSGSVEFNRGSHRVQLFTTMAKKQSLTAGSLETSLSPKVAIVSTTIQWVYSDAVAARIANSTASTTVSSFKLGLTVIGCIAISLVAVVMSSSVVYYLWRQRLKRKKYELVPLRDLSAGGSDSEA